MADEKMTAADFKAKVEWEGGIVEALDYGLKHTHLDGRAPAALYNAWKKLEELYAPLREQMRVVDELLDDLPDEDDDQDDSDAPAAVNA
jgi:hypothetical protein